MPRRRRRRLASPRASQPTGDHSDSPRDSPSSSPFPLSDLVVLVSVFAIYWVYAHLDIAVKCIKKLNDLLFRYWGYDRLNIPHSGILYWQFTLHSIPLMLLFILVVINFAPASYIVLVDVIFMCIFCVLDMTR